MAIYIYIIFRCTGVRVCQLCDYLLHKWSWKTMSNYDSRLLVWQIW